MSPNVAAVSNVSPVCIGWSGWDKFTVALSEASKDNSVFPIEYLLSAELHIKKLANSKIAQVPDSAAAVLTSGPGCSRGGGRASPPMTSRKSKHEAIKQQFAEYLPQFTHTTAQNAVRK